VRGAALGDRVRFALGAGCVALAAGLLVWHLPSTVGSLDAQVASDDSYIHNSLTREVTTGDSLGIPYALQVAALADIPPGARYALLLPADQQVASIYAISPLAFETVAAFLEYLLLPAVPVAANEARYIICWGCDTAPWDHRTDWLWQTDAGEAIGRVLG
jgi:hypothetical protein